MAQTQPSWAQRQFVSAPVSYEHTMPGTGHGAFAAGSDAGHGPSLESGAKPASDGGPASMQPLSSQDQVPDGSQLHSSPPQTPLLAYPHVAPISSQSDPSSGGPGGQVSMTQGGSSQNQRPFWQVHVSPQPSELP